MFARSKAPNEIFPSSNSSPKSSFSYVDSLSKAALIMTKGSLNLEEFLWIFLATSSLPEPVGPEIRTLLSEVESLFITFLTLVIDWLLPTISKEWKSLFSIIFFSFLRSEDSKALFT